MLQAKVNKGNYNSYVVIYHKIRAIMLRITAQLKYAQLDVNIYMISEDRYNLIKLSPHMFIS